MQLEIGDLVNDPNEPKRLHCGSGIYPHAVVMSLQPFILVSESSDMKWTQQQPDGLVKVGKADEKTIKRCMRRMTEGQDA